MGMVGESRVLPSAHPFGHAQSLSEESSIVEFDHWEFVMLNVVRKRNYLIVQVFFILRKLLLLLLGFFFTEGNVQFNF